MIDEQTAAVGDRSSSKRFWRFSLVMVLVLPTAAPAQVGGAIAMDGDSIRFGENIFRLFGIDAPELDQPCQRATGAWPCGREAKAILKQALEGGQLDCAAREIDRYGRSVATCSVGGRDLAQVMVESGYATALPDGGPEYAAAEGRARGARIGIWAGTFDKPADYRKAHPRAEHAIVDMAKSAPAPRTQPRGQPRPQPGAVVARPTRPTGRFMSCAAAWAAGLAPFRRGQPGYRVEQDSDLDGISCEPIRKR